jgi:NAD(P) transhydrogenase subunit beta
MLGSAATARRGNLVSAIGMLLAVVVTLLAKEILSYEWIIVGIIVGSLVGYIAAVRVKMTAMPGRCCRARQLPPLHAKRNP